jgi:hypothetical protein
LSSAPSPDGSAPALAVANASAASGRGFILTGQFPTEYYSGETLADVLRRRAPLYLRPRPNPSADFNRTADPIAVYIDGSFAGSLDVLQLIPAYEVIGVERLAASEATIRFGPRHNSGALLVKMVKHD